MNATVQSNVNATVNASLNPTVTPMGVRILDGSTGYVLLQNGLPEDELFSKIWSARALVDEQYHRLVIDTHKKYLEVGATAITTNSYATQPTYYEKVFGDGFEAVMLEHVELSAKLAVTARAEFLAEHPDFLGQVQILGSLPPLVESHRPDVFQAGLAQRGEEFFLHHYKNMAIALLKGGADVLLFETLNCMEEARLGLDAMVSLSPAAPIMVSFEGSIRDEQLVPQPHLAPDLVERVLDYKTNKGLQITMVGWNCAPPEDILDNLKVLQSSGTLATLKRHGVGMSVYANLNERKIYDEGFDVEQIDTSSLTGTEKKDSPKAKVTMRKDMTQSEDGDPFSGYVCFAQTLVRDFGVCAVGGCCGCGPGGIAAVNAALARSSRM